jgi:hypothetical protein
VPTEDPTLTEDTNTFVEAAFDRQTTHVPVIHDELVHTASDIVTEPVRS